MTEVHATGEAFSLHLQILKFLEIHNTWLLMLNFIPLWKQRPGQECDHNLEKCGSPCRKGRALIGRPPDQWRWRKGGGRRPGRQTAARGGPVRSGTEALVLLREEFFILSHVFTDFPLISENFFNDSPFKKFDLPISWIYEYITSK